MDSGIDFSRIEDSEDISERNKELIKKFLRHMKTVIEVSDRRIEKYKTELGMLGEWVDFNFDEASQEDIKSLVAKIKNSGYSKWTVHDYKVCLKKFYKELFGEKDGYKKEYPPEVSWIKCTYNGEEGGITLPEQLLQPEDVKTLINAAPNKRDRCFIHMLYESGARLNEIRDVQMKDIDFNGKSVDVRFKTLKNKNKGPRKLCLVSSAGAIKEWIEEHPKSDDKDAYLFCIIAGDRKGEKTSERNIYHILDRAAKKTDIDKDHNPHAFRHAAASQKAQWMTEAQMDYWFGWAQGSEMPSFYIHLNGDNVKTAVEEHHGIKSKEEVKSPMDPKKCPRCGEESIDPTKNFCPNCSLALTEEKALEHKEVSEAAEKIAEALLEGEISKEEVINLTKTDSS